jgi:hypothetical protein
MRGVIFLQATTLTMAVMLYGCDGPGPAPDVKCIDGTYHLQGADDVTLTITRGQFTAQVRHSRLFGDATYDSKDHSIGFSGGARAVMQSDIDAITAETRIHGDAMASLDALREGGVCNIYQAGEVVIECDVDSGVNFTKASCAP